MTNRELVARIDRKLATPAERREYARRTQRLAEAYECKHGHFECALVKGGPCLDETLAGAEEPDPEEVAEGARELSWRHPEARRS